MHNFINVSLAATTCFAAAIFVSSRANAALECRTAEVQDPNMCQKVCDAIKAAGGDAGHLSIFKFQGFAPATYSTPTNEKLWDQNKASGYRSPVKITTCTVAPSQDSKTGCRITMCGFMPTFRDQYKAKATQPNMDTSRYTQPKPKVGPPGLLEGDAVFNPQGPAATGTPVGPAGGAPTYNRGGIR